MNNLIVIDKRGGHNSYEQNKLRIDFIKEHFPESKTCDPYQSNQLIKAIKDKLINAGLYKSTSAGWLNLLDETIIRYILKVQGRNINRRNKRSKNGSLYLGE